ncbi:U32 family peptidase [Carboxydocella sp. ULO1]|uniref:peptidase U32 family protein n=1 Tax=Carboxydocella sp. ULO1 TaxID=1926599 RepID=UPI0009AD57E3|nr:U32 family peptidase [Carboxydocella sp. ULO1]GAW27806.1 peptidase U32 [Carboxydocella sp. ULO1]
MKPELLAPAGNLEKLKTAIDFGADAVYLAGQRFGLRARAGNFSRFQLEEGLNYARQRGRKVYVTVNIFAHNRDLEDLPAYLEELQELAVDGLIIADPGVFSLARRYAPRLPLHISTQANITNKEAARFWADQGAERLVLARELTEQEIGEIRRYCPETELEVFVHGAMCISYSGRCLLSSYMTGRDANQGDCAQACRWSYALVEEIRPGEYYPILEDERGTYIFNSADLCLLEYLPRLMAAGVNSLKIEGRMKSVHYVGTVVKVYRQAIDAWLADPEGWQCREEWLEELAKVSHRPYTTGFFLGWPPQQAGQHYLSAGYIREYDFVGIVREETPQGLWVEQRGPFATGEELEVLTSFGPNRQLRVEKMFNEAGEAIDRAPHPRQLVLLPGVAGIPAGSLLRRAKQ